MYTQEFFGSEVSTCYIENCMELQSTVNNCYYGNVRTLLQARALFCYVKIMGGYAKFYFYHFKLFIVLVGVAHKTTLKNLP